MIYTVTFNPSLDYIVSVENFKLGLTNRTSSELLLPGGKGINVSTVLMNLGIESTALGFIAGFTGDEVVRRLEQMGVKNGFIRIPDGFTRINLKLKSIDGTEVNGQGPKIGKEKVEQLMEQLDELKEGDVLFLSGSIPASMPSDAYQKIMERLKDKGIHIVVDATEDLLMNVLPYHPFLIKPNLQEMIDIFYLDVENMDDIIRYAKNLQNMGARNVLVSLGADGAVLVTETGEIYRHSAMSGKVHNTVGCGDSMLAGFLVGYQQNHDMVQAFQLSLAAASANAFHDGRGTYEDIMDLLDILHREIEE